MPDPSKIEEPRSLMTSTLQSLHSMRSVTRVSQRYYHHQTSIGWQSKCLALQRPLRTTEQARLKDGPTLSIKKISKHTLANCASKDSYLPCDAISTAFHRTGGVLDGTNDLRNTGAKDEALEEGVAEPKPGQVLSSGLDTKDADRASDAIADFEKLLIEGRAEVEDVRAILRTRKAQVLELPQSEQRQAAAIGRIGGRCLQWLWENRLDSLKEDIDGELAKDLCWFLHAEGLTSYVDRWIEVDVHEYASTGSKYYGHIKCAAVLLAAQVQSEAAWSVDGNYDTALEFLRSRKEHFNTVGLGDVPCWFPSSVQIQQFLLTEECLPVKDALFDWFLDFAQKLPGSGMSALALRLHHPSNPDAYAFLKAAPLLYSRYSKKPFDYRRISALSNYALRAEYILQLKGDFESSNTLQKLVMKYSYLTWGNRESIHQKCRNDPKLAHLHSEAEARKRQEEDAPRDL
ncbi:hypothetical protein AC578_3848, partial [Pseudocercospora eumusae]